MPISINDIERKSSYFRSKKFEFAYTDYFPFRENKLYRILYTKDKNQVFIDFRGRQLLPMKNNTLFGKYRKTKAFLFRESYLKPYKIVLTKQLKEKETITRYFAQYKLDKYDIIFEINKQDFGRRSNFYDKVSVIWQLKGSKEGVRMKNEESLKLAENSLPGIQNFLDPLQFYEEELTLLEKLQKKISNLKY
tara:strand:- start:42 stop:617 length:576 start_codon:yes stop_codon:yes gene_type:complete